MRVSPVRSDLVINRGETKTVSVTLQNVTNATGIYKIIVNDFEARDETGAPSLLLGGETNSRHGLKKFITAPKTISVASGEQKEIQITIAIPSNAAAGGYFGAIRFAPASTGDNNENVSLSGSVASLLLVRVSGEVTENLQVVSIDVRKGNDIGTFFVDNNNLKAAIRFRNAGNVQEQPFGKVLLKKGDTVLGQYELNDTDPRGNVLPDSIRLFKVDLKDVGSFGKYTVEGNFGYGTSGQLVSASTTFFIVPLLLLIAIATAVGLLVLAVVMIPKLIKRHDQRLIRRVGRR